MGIFSEMFIWWGGNTFGTRVFTWRRGKFVGEDERGNKYYLEKKTGPLGYKRRWVIYNGLSEASTIPADWHSWIHYTSDLMPSEENYKPKHWQKRHESNKTGSSGAYRPKGSTLNPDRKDALLPKNYDAWRPE